MDVVVKRVLRQGLVLRHGIFLVELVMGLVGFTFMRCVAIFVRFMDCCCRVVLFYLVFVTRN